MSMQLNASNAGSFGELANFCCIRIDENADGVSSFWERVHNSADHGRLDVARTPWIKIEPNHVRAQFDARTCVVRVRNAANLNLYRSHFRKTDEAGIGISHGEMAVWQHASQTEQNARAPHLWTSFR